MNVEIKIPKDSEVVFEQLTSTENPWLESYWNTFKFFRMLMPKYSIRILLTKDSIALNRV